MNAFLSGPLGAVDARGWLMRRRLAGGAVVALADWLFYREPPGLSLVVFALALGAVSALINPVRAVGRARWVAGACLLLGALPVLVDPNLLSCAFLVAGLVAGSLVLAGPGLPSPARVVTRVLAAPLTGPSLVMRDSSRLQRIGRRRPGPAKLRANPVGWIVPLGLGAAFLLLFAWANPVLEGWLASIDARLLLDWLSPVRLGFWIATLVVCWPMLHVRAARRARSSGLPAVSLPIDDALFGPEAIQRSLLVFNALFAVQTTMDLAYLWSGRALPDGMTYATYAHRGAYPLAVTALLAGAFVLVATRDRQGAIPPWTRWLLLAFVAQNILLVTSALLRLDLYVAAYGLTELRLAAGAWMALVAFGLATIVVQVESRRSRAWLLAVNGVAAAGTLYAACFVNEADLIARFNLEHASLTQAAPLDLDWDYLQSLGPQAIPAMDAFVRNAPAADLHVKRVQVLRAWFVRELQRRPAGWRQWSYEAWRLDGYLANAGTGPGQD